ncbi:MAG TPA: Rne/Rng family ribonuclease [Streptosporangiaceae bacterium]|jgi:ribonuclease E
MLENEPKNGTKSDEQRDAAEPVTDAAAAVGAEAGAVASSSAGGRAPAKATRTRRTRATRPAGPPVADVPPPQTGSDAASAPRGAVPSGQGTGSDAPPAQVFSAPEPQVSTSRPAQPPAPAGFTAPEAAPAATAAEPPGRVAQTTFQAPQLIFQPPPESAPGSAPRKADDDAAPATADGDEQDAAGDGDQGGDDGGRSRRRRGGRSRSKGKAGENGDEPAAQDEKAAADGSAKDGGPKASGGKASGGKGGSGKSSGAKASGAKASGGKASGGKASGAKGGSDDDAKDGTGAEAEAADGDDDEAEQGDGTARRRRRRRKRGGSSEGDQPAPDDPPETVVHVREPRSSGRGGKAKDEVQGLRGSTRLEAKRQRRREGRDSGRRRPPIITESEFLARREAVDRSMVVRQRGEHTQIAVLEDDILVEHYVDRTSHQSFVGNVYLGKVQNVLPSMEAAFVDIGKGRNAVLYAGEVNFDASGLEGQTRRIESALKSGQSVLVQVTKDPVGHKGARLTSQVSLPGRYLVYVPGASMTGISRKLPDTERTRLKQILKQVMPEGAGVIVRTAAEGATEDELAQDVSRLSAQWESIERKSKSASPPSLLYSEPDLTIRVIRDIFNEDFSRLIVSGGDGWDTVDDYVHYVAPHLVDRLTRWQDEQDVFAHYRIDEQLAKALDRKVWLPSGGSLVIDKTEAMTVIDVNTGKFTGQGGNLEETVTRNNLEAAEEIVRQLRLRDIGGIIVIDFIDMVLESNRDLVLRRLLECLARDRTKHQVAEVTSLGLVQMTRKRVGSGLLEAFSVTCESCNGRGVHVSLEPTEQSSGAPRQRGDERGGHGSGSDDKPSSGSRRRRRKSAAAAADSAPAGNGAAEAVAAIASASTDSSAAAAESAEAHPNGHPDAKADAGANADAGAKADAGAQADAQPQADAATQADAQAQADTQPRADSGPRADGEQQEPSGVTAGSETSA